MYQDDQELFMMSFRQDKSRPEDFGLVRDGEGTGVYLRRSDGSRWIQRDLYDYGWGNEYGFVRLPEPDFERLWRLLTRSKIQDNRYGAAYELETRFTVELINRLGEVFSRSQPVAPSLAQALEILDLNKVGDFNHLTAQARGQDICALETLYQKQQLIHWKQALLKDKQGCGSRNRNALLWVGLLLLIWALTVAGRSVLHQLAQQANVKEVLQWGRLARLPRDFSALAMNNPEEANRTPAAESKYLKFCAPRRQIERFLGESQGLRGVRPRPFQYSEWYQAHRQTLSRHAWFDPIIRKGRVFDLPAGARAVSRGVSRAVSGQVIVDDAGGTLFIEMARR